MTFNPQDPTADLNSDPFSYSGNWKYPLTLGSSRYGHWINFNAMVPSASRYKGETTQQLGSGIPNLSGMEKGLNSLGSSVADSKIGKIVDAIGGEGSADALSSFGSKAKDFYSIIMTPGSVSPSGGVSLYTPDSISLSQLITYNSISKTEALGNVGLAAEAAAQGGSAYDQINRGDGTAKGSLMGSTFNNPLAAEGIGVAGQKSGALGQGATQMALAKGGFAKNPQLEVIFQQVEFREYQFNFTFTPKNAKEAQEIKEIIDFFRFHQLPELDRGGAGRYFIVPSFFQLEHIYQGKLNSNLHKFAPCVLKSIFIDYAPNGWVTYEDAFPVQTMMVLAFQEIEIMTKERINQGY